MKDNCVIIPVYNEPTQQVLKLKDEIQKYVSADIAIAGRELSQEDIKLYSSNNIIVFNYVKGDLTSQVLETMKKVDSRYIAVIDSDFQHPPELLPKMFYKIKSGYDIVVAKRRTYGMNGLRILISKTLGFLSSVKVGYRTDVLSGYFVIDKEFVDYDKAFRNLGFKILLSILKTGRYDVAEIEYDMRKRVAGKSKADTRNGIKLLKFIFLTK
jgi:dolichol-phosphate mannosyltransferase